MGGQIPGCCAILIFFDVFDAGKNDGGVWRYPPVRICALLMDARALCGGSGGEIRDFCEGKKRTRRLHTLSLGVPCWWEGGRGQMNVTATTAGLQEKTVWGQMVQTLGETTGDARGVGSGS